MTSKPKSNLVVRSWRAVKGFFAGIGRAIFTKEFWVDLVVSALRDALHGLGYSIGMRFIKASSGGDINFQDKQGVVATNVGRTGDAGSAFASQSPNRDWPKTPRSYGSVQDDIMAQPATSYPYTQRSYKN